MRWMLPVLVMTMACDPGSPDPEQPTDICGDGEVQTSEQCDDGNELGGDGCSDVCQVEPGHAFEGLPPEAGGVPETIGVAQTPLRIHGILDSAERFQFSNDTFSDRLLSITVLDANNPAGCDFTLNGDLFLDAGGGVDSDFTPGGAAPCLELSLVVPSFALAILQITGSPLGASTEYLIDADFQ